MIRLIFVLRRKPSMSREDFQKYWYETHAPLVAKHATTLGILRYLQDHTLDDPMNEQMAQARGGMEPPYDGVAELWWTTRQALASRHLEGANGPPSALRARSASLRPKSASRHGCSLPQLDDSL